MLGDGIFETMQMTPGGQVLFWDRHHARLQHGCNLIGLALPDYNWLAAFQTLYHANMNGAGISKENTASYVLRLSVSRGVAAGRGLWPPAIEKATTTVILTLAKLPTVKKDVSLHIATVTRRNEFSPLSQMKSAQYLDHILAMREARAQGCDDALLLNTAGHVACTTTASVFAIFSDGRLITPPLCDGAIAGTRRQFLLERGINGKKIDENSLTIKKIYQSSCFLLVNALSVRFCKVLNNKDFDSNLGRNMAKTWQDCLNMAEMCL